MPQAKAFIRVSIIGVKRIHLQNSHVTFTEKFEINAFENYILTEVVVLKKSITSFIGPDINVGTQR